MKFPFSKSHATKMPTPERHRRSHVEGMKNPSQGGAGMWYQKCYKDFR